MNFNPSAMTKRVQLMQPNSVKDSTGDPAEDAPFGGLIWAEIRPMSGSEAFRAQQFTEKADTTIIIRYRPGVHSSMQVQYADPQASIRTFHIHAPLNEEEKGVMLTLLCEEINP